ncbi:J domain-containing protein [Microbaculum marinum]|uniref:J domain-containing protein n=1 Tax=Microbaculum marinum TaxID=1764581 RepID=A0AAW9RV25_9HYPH
MAAARALYVALDLARVPTLAGLIREQPLPPGILMLIKIGAGSQEALEDAVCSTGESPGRIREAAALYLEQVLLAGNSDSYRTLGVEPDASQETLREHMRWLMKWLHPDRNRSDWEVVFAERVIAAWQDLKSPERRAAYDRSLQLAPRPKPARRVKSRPVPLRLPWRIEPVVRADTSRPWYRRILLTAAAAATVAAVLLLPSPNPEPTATVMAEQVGNRQPGARDPQTNVGRAPTSPGDIQTVSTAGRPPK